MTIRVWASPPVLVDGVYYTKAEQYCTGGFINFFPSNEDGTPASSWVLTVGRASNWSAAVADPELRDVFVGDLPSAVDTIPEFKQLLRNVTIGQVAAARRNAIGAHLDALGVARADFTASTTMMKVFQRIVSTLMEKDARFAEAFNF